MELPPRLRRCRHLMLEPRGESGLDAAEAMQGRLVVRHHPRWQGWTPHLEGPVSLTDEDLPLLSAVGPDDWVATDALCGRFGTGRVQAMVTAGLLLGSHAAHAPLRAVDDAWRDGRWWTPSAVAHGAARWRDVDSEAGGAGGGIAAMIQRFGPPPPSLAERETTGSVVGLVECDARAPLDALLRTRRTCRNFDAGQPLGLPPLSRVLARSFGVLGGAQLAPGAEALKKPVPSGGGLHPVEALLVARRVEGLDPGAWQYDAAGHRLLRLRCALPGDLDAWLLRAMAGQPWFTGAAAFVILVARFERSQWKYRNHPKAYRVALLDAGHLGQAVALAATEEGLGVFLTAALNEAMIEADLGLASGREGVVAICGLGHRAGTLGVPELGADGLLGEA